MREKQLLDEQAAFDKKYNDDQSLHLHNLLHQAEKQHHADRRAMAEAMKDYNQQLAREKKDADNKWRTDQLMQDAHEQQYTLTHDFMTENPLTEKSALADHRVKPYHFKGLNAEQKAAIMHERAQQIKEHEIQKKNKQEEDRLWALQQEHLRRQQVLKDREMKKQSRLVAAGTRSTQEQQHSVAQEFWKDPYDQKGPARTDIR